MAAKSIWEKFKQGAPSGESTDAEFTEVNVNAPEGASEPVVPDKPKRGRPAKEAPAKTPAKTSRSKKEDTPASKPATRRVTWLLVDVYLTPSVKSRHLEELAGPAMVAAAKEAGAPNWRLAEYGTGDGLLLKHFEEMLEGGEITLPAFMHCHASERSAQVLLPVLEGRPDVIVVRRG